MPTLLNPSRIAVTCCLVALLLVLAPTAFAGGPKYVAGVSFFNPAVLGQPIQWAGGQIRYFVDQGPLNESIDNQQATAMVDAAAALWSAVPTAGVTLTDAGQLNEDVSGANIVASTTAASQIAQPSDVTPAAASYPVGVIFDADGSVIDALFGTGASDPTSCQLNGVWVWMDSINPDATIAHAIMVLNGRCATTASLMQMMNYEIERAFGSILGLGYSQVNPGAVQTGDANAREGWPVMDPRSGTCGPSGGTCIPSPNTLHYDDVAALNRIYPVTAANLASFPGKQITAAHTVSFQGTVRFRTGYGMQGVNVVARPLDASGNPLDEYAVTAVSGACFNGKHGNPMTGPTDSNGNRFDMWGSNDPAMQGAFDLSDIPLPPGVIQADYEITFEAIDPLDILTESVGPYSDGQVVPSGTLPPVYVRAVSAGSAQTLAVTAADSAAGGFQDAIAAESQPRTMSASGFWSGRLSQVGQTDWLLLPARGNRLFTIVTEALDETGAPTQSKAMPSIGVWDAFSPVGSAAAGAAPGMNGSAIGETWLRVATNGSDMVRIGIADQRGDGRPDYAYQGWVLYADTVSPARLPASGGTIVIHGMGFRLADTVLVGGQPAQVTSISPNEITAIAPAAPAGVTGPVDVEVDDAPVLYASAILGAGISYDAGTGDALNLVTAPMNTVPTGVPIPFTVTALGPDLTPAGGVTVLYTVTSGTATLGCGQPSCVVTATGDGRASLHVTAVDGTLSVVTASLSNGSSVQAHFAGGTPPTLAALTPQISLAAGATVAWPVQVMVLANGVPAGGQLVQWQTSVGGIAPQAAVAISTNASGVATQTLSVGPLAEGQTVSINACLNGTSQCVAFTALGARPEFATLQPVAGTSQSLSVAGTPGQMVLRVLDMNGNPMAGGTVSLYQTLYAWAPPCPAHGVCAQAELLATGTATATSALDGTVTFAPASLPGVATNLVGLAVTGNSAAANIAVERHP